MTNPGKEAEERTDLKVYPVDRCLVDQQRAGSLDTETDTDQDRGEDVDLLVHKED